MLIITIVGSALAIGIARRPTWRNIFNAATSRRHERGACRGAALKWPASSAHYERAALVQHRTPLWMYEETVHPDRFGAVAES